MQKGALLTIVFQLLVYIIFYDYMIYMSYTIYSTYKIYKTYKFYKSFLSYQCHRGRRFCPGMHIPAQM